MRKILFVVIIVCFIFSISGCSQNKSSDETNSSGGVQPPSHDTPPSPSESPFLLSSDFYKVENNIPKMVDSAETSSKKILVYEMATISNVPLAYGIGFLYDGTTTESKYTTLTIEEKTIEGTFQTCTKEIKKTQTGIIDAVVELISELMDGKLDDFPLFSKHSGSIENSKTTTFQSSQKIINTSQTEITKTITSKDTDYKKGNNYRIVLVSAFKTYLYAIYDKVLDKINLYYNLEEMVNPEQKKFVVEETSSNTFGSHKVVTYKSVDPIADGIKESSVSSDLITKRTRNDEHTITASGRFKQHHDDFTFTNLFNYNIEDLKKAGYKTLNIDLQIDIKEVNNGYQYIMIYAHSASSGEGVDGCEIEHGGTKKDTTYKTYHYSFSIDLNKFNEDVIIIRYGASGKDYDNWKNKNLKIQFTISKENNKNN